MGFLNILDPVLDPLLKLHPALAIFIVSFAITLLVTLVYKLTTDQKKMKQLKDDLSESQKKIRAMAKDSKPEKAMALQKEAMQKNLEYMKHSFKSTLYTMIPVLVIFWWLSANIAYYPIAPNSVFTVTAYFAQGSAPEASLSAIPELEHINNASQTIAYDDALKSNAAIWKLKGNSGKYDVEIDYSGEKYSHEVLISEGRKYTAPEKIISDSKLKKITVGNEKVYPFTLFGLKFTWFWTYLIMSVIMSLGLRKLMKVY